MPDDELGPYLLRGRIGRGGMGEVHRAIDRAHGGRWVALKLLAPELSADPDYRARFGHEAELAARLADPHIVAIHRYGEIEGTLFLEMQLVDGPDLGTVLERGGRLHPERAVAIVEQVAQALDTAHRAGLVHRDVKPSNILLRAAPDRPELALLTDFGIAAAGATGEGPAGTVEYLAPEALRGAAVDARVDVYALACVLHELLTGLRAFPGVEFAAQVHGHLRLPPPRPSQLAPGVPVALDSVVAAGMAKDPARRPATAGALAVAARTALDPPVGATRHRVLLGAGLALLAGGTGAGWLLLRSRGPVPVLTERALSTALGSREPLRITTVAGNPAVLLVDLDDSVRVRGLVDDRDVGPALPYSNPALTVAFDLDGRPVLARGTEAGEIDLLDLLDGTPLRRIRVHDAPVLALVPVELDGVAVLASLGRDGVLARTRAADGVAAGPPVAAVTGEIFAARLDTAGLGGAPVLLTPGMEGLGGAVRDVRTGALRYRTAVTDPVVAELGGRAVEVFAYDVVGVEDLATRDRLREHPALGARVAATAVLDGRPVVVTDDGATALVIRDLDSGEPLGDPLTGHDAPVTTLATGELGGRPILVSAALDNTLRVWDLASRAGG